MDALNPSNNLPIGEFPQFPQKPADNGELNIPGMPNGATAEASDARKFTSPERFTTRFEWAELRQKLAASIGLESCRVRALHKAEQEGVSLAIVAEETLRMAGLPRLWGGKPFNSHFALVSFPDTAPEQAREIFSWDAIGGSHESKAAIANGAPVVAYILNEPGSQHEIAVVFYNQDTKPTINIKKVSLSEMKLWDTAQYNLVTIALSPDAKFLWVQNSNNDVACIGLSSAAPVAVPFRGDINVPELGSNRQVLSQWVGPEEKIRFTGDGSAVQIVDRLTYLPRREFQIDYLSECVHLGQTAAR